MTASNGVTWKRIASRWQNPRAKVAKAKVQAVSRTLRQVDQRTLQLADLVCAHFRNHCDGLGSGTIVAKVTFTLDSGAAVSAAPKSLRCKLKSRDRT